ncbi:hypothetical protein DICVIV_02590 [Dictyocaulus viviparus]|uniref:Rootletin-like coiled-coil domain-containing protein n=1 Tax=Dictyocaulus viviparus TaxID=29172 RepID=A0A0D8Y3F5_DICVI|nr:hypothetical protein DICVIV_02590 [Dictyocaulus viviparus]
MRGHMLFWRLQKIAELESSSCDFRHDYSPIFLSSPRLLQYSEEIRDSENENIDEIISRLKNELFKNNTLEEINYMLREENDAALEANDNLRQDVVQLSRTLEQLERGVRNDRERFNIENARYRNHMEQQHRRLTELWKSFMALKRKVRDLHASTASDLDKQLTEFTRCAAIVKKAIRHTEFKNAEWRDKAVKEKDIMLEEVMVKYELLSTTQIETEKQLLEKTRQLQRLQEEFQQTRKNYYDLESALARICSMIQHSSPSSQQRARSESPSFPRMANDAIRKIRSVLTMRAAEIKEVNMRFEHAELEVNRLKKQIDLYENEKRSQKDYERRRDQEANERELQLVAMENDLRRTVERLSTLEQDRNMKESLITTMQNTLTSTHRNHKEFIEGLVSNHRDELIAREKLHEREVTERLNEVCPLFFFI